MSPLWNLGVEDGPVGLALGAAILVLLLWLGWRKPTLVFLIALAFLALRPELLWGGPEIGYGWGLHHTLIAIALVMSALRYGLRRMINWPILALIAVFALNLAFGELHADLTVALMGMTLALLALPFVFPQVILEPGSRRWVALIITTAPLLSVALGGLLQLLGMREVFDPEAWAGHRFRLEGATGNAAVFALLAFAGFAVALHEWTRPGRPHEIHLAVLNLALVILSGTRMAMLASVVFLAVYAGLSQALRARLKQQRWKMSGGAVLVAVTLAVYWPTLIGRLFAGDDAAFALSRRDELWSFYWQEFLFSPWFGRGLGAGFVAGEKWIGVPLSTPHDEYLHLLVIGGAFGFVLMVAGITLWYRQILRLASFNDREFLRALAPALVVYAVTDNVLVYSSALAVFAYLGVVLTRPSWSAMPRSADADRKLEAAEP